MFSIDWLQLFCSRDLVEIEPTRVYTSPRVDMYGNHRDYYLRPAKEYLHGYRVQYRVMYKQYDVATIAYDHVDQRVARHACAIKVANAVLYVANWRFIVEDILATFNWKPNNITRVDLCCDFNRFDTLDPKTFMYRYFADRNAKFETYTRVGSNKFHIDGERLHDHVDVQTIRWGSRQNGVSTYMYNKSLELKAHKYKKYIVQAWDKADIIYTDPNRPVWRVEFSISSKGVALKDLELDEVKTLWLNDFDEAAKVRELWQIFAKQYFRFQVIPRLPQPLVKKQNLDDLVLWNFDDDVPPYKPITLCVSVDSGRTERLISKRLSELATTLDDASFMSGRDFTAEAQQLYKASEVFDEVADVKHYRRSFEVDEEHARAAGVPLDIDTEQAYAHLHQRERLVKLQQRIYERNFLIQQSEKRRKGLKISTLGGGSVFPKVTPASGKEVTNES